MALLYMLHLVLVALVLLMCLRRGGEEGGGDFFVCLARGRKGTVWSL